MNTAAVNSATSISPIFEVGIAMISMLVTFFLTVTTAYILFKIIKWELFKRKLRKIDFNEYTVFTTDNGMPKVLQHKKNSNKFVFL